MIDLDSNKLRNINKPARYIGGEVNQVIKKNSNFRIVLCYPNLYEKAMSNYQVNLLYNNINLLEGVWCKRCFAPDVDFEEYIRENKYEIYSLEDFKELKEDDILLFIIDNELDFTNLLNMLELSKIDIYNRDKTSPKVILFVSNDINIKPIEKFCDYIFNYKSQKENIQRLLVFLSTYNNKNKELSSDNMDDITKDYNSVVIKQVENGIVPSIKINNSSIVINFEYMNDIEEILEYIQKNIKARGINKVSFFNIDKIGNYKFCEIVYKIKTNIEDVRIIGKNLDFNKFEPELFDILLPCLERTSVFFDVVTCSSRLKEKIEVGTDENVLLERINKVFRNNRNSIKLKFNIAIPDETYEDIDYIFELLDKIVTIYSKNRAKDKFSMKVILDYYIPDKQNTINFNINGLNKLDTKLMYIKEKKYDSIIKIEVADRYLLPARVLLKKAGEDIADIIYEAYKLGARFDCDYRKFKRNVWDKILYENMDIVQKYLMNNSKE